MKLPLLIYIHGFFYYNKPPFSTGRETPTFHSVGENIGRVAQTSAKVVGAAKTAYDVGMTIHRLGSAIAPFLI